MASDWSEQYKGWIVKHIKNAVRQSWRASKAKEGGRLELRSYTREDLLAKIDRKENDVPSKTTQ